MTWRYSQSSGVLTRDSRFVARGYSGHGEGKNNPAMQGTAGIGPIPRGTWRLAAVYDSRSVGPFAIRLEAQDGTPDDCHSPTGRSAFRIHGDSIRAPGTASRGCIILPRAIREAMWRSDDHALEVTL